MGGDRLTGLRGLAVGLGIVLALGIVGQILNANVLSNQGEQTKYGQLHVPGSGVLPLPSGSFEGILEDNLEEDLKITPRLRLSIDPLGGLPAPSIERDVGEQYGTSSGNFGPDTYYRRVWRVDVGTPGRYRVAVGGAGPDSGYFLDLGHGPPADAATIWLWTGIAALIVLALWFANRTIARGRERRLGPG